MQLLHHQIAMREDDGEFVCRRCGLINPGDDDACIPVDLGPAESGNTEEEAAARTVWSRLWTKAPA